MEAFKEAWQAIDADSKGYVSSDDLLVYLKKQNYDESFVEKWKKVFDPEDTGIIKLEVFCDVLGLTADEVVVGSSTKTTTDESDLPSDVQFISGSMEIGLQVKVVQIVKDALSNCPKMAEVPKRSKLTLDKTFGKDWHVVIAHGQFWCYFGFEPGYSFAFRIGKRVFIVFKTPEV